MIVSSYRCFLNVVTQLYDRETLLNANYYIADADMHMTQVCDMGYNNCGQIVEKNSGMPVSMGSNAASVYNVNKIINDIFNPSRFEASVSTQGGGYNEVVQEYVKALNNIANLKDIHHFLFTKPPAGNSLQFLIFRSDTTIERYGHILCQYLAYNFGIDIIFIDPVYRSNKVVGQQQYAGNKENAKIMFQKIEEYNIISHIIESKTGSTFDGSLCNLTTYLSTFKADKLCYIYNLLFPETPLPPGEYTDDMLIQMISGRVLEERNESNKGLFTSPSTSHLKSLFSNSSLESILNEFDDNIGDDSDDFEFIGH